MRTWRWCALAAVAALLAACSSGSTSSSNSPQATATPPSATPAVAPAPSVPTQPSVSVASAVASAGPSATRRTPSPAPLTSRSASTPTVLRKDDNGKTIHIARGTVVHVRLDGAGWTDPTAGASSVLRRTSTEQRHQSARASFEAVGRGTTTISARQTSGTHWLVHIVVR